MLDMARCESSQLTETTLYTPKKICFANLPDLEVTTVTVASVPTANASVLQLKEKIRKKASKHGPNSKYIALITYPYF